MRFFLGLFLCLFAAPLCAQTAIETYSVAGGVASGAKVSFANGIYRVENRVPGSFSIRFPLSKPLDANQITRFSFDWKPSVGTKINLFFKIAGRYSGAILTGPESVRAGAVSWGRAVQTRQDDGFLRVDIPLRALAKADNPTAQTLPIEEILLGNWSNENYLMAGMGGNGVGEFYELKNINFAPISAAQTPRLGAARFDDNDLLVPIHSINGVETNGLKLRVFEKRYDLTSPLVKLETSPNGEQTLRFHAGAAGVKLGDGATLPFGLEGLATPLEGTADLNYSGLKTPPKPRVLAGETPLLIGDFEADNFAFVPGAATPDRVFDRVRGANVLRLTNPRIGARFDTLLRASLDAKQFPVLHFWYRADDRVRLDLGLTWGGTPYTIRFLDRDALTKNQPAGAAIRLGEIADANGDNTWREARFDLLAALRKQKPDAVDFKIQNLSFSDFGWMGNARGVQLFLDDFTFAPALASGTELRVTLADLSGIGLVSWALSEDSLPQELGQTKRDSRISLPSGEKGLWFLHVRAQNGAENWSETATTPLWLDGS